MPTVYVLSINMKIVKKKKSTENCHFYSREKSLYVAWACFRNVLQAFMAFLVNSNVDDSIKPIKLAWIYGARCEKYGLRGFRPGQTQTKLCSHRRRLEA